MDILFQPYSNFLNQITVARSSLQTFQEVPVVRVAQVAEVVPAKGCWCGFHLVFRAYFGLRRLGSISLNGSAQGKGLSQSPPAFEEKFRKVLTKWFCTAHSLFPKNFEGPAVNYKVKELLAPLSVSIEN